MAIMMLAERGKLDFDDHLLTYFPRFPAWAAGITLRHMPGGFVLAAVKDDGISVGAAP